jgi:CDP-2,3-bis-(O-geranylgeranyl)-sn-glycerol synthase
MLTVIFSAIYLILPSYLANMFPVIFGKLHMPFGTPINEKLFGSHKTYRGFYAAYIGAFLMLLLQYYFAKNGIFEDYSLLDYEKINLFLYAFIFGIGTATGDTVKSFFKRRLKKAPGSPWFPFDQLDFVIMSLLFLAPFFIPSWQVIVTILILTPFLHFLVNVFAYIIGMKKVWW